MLKKNNFILNKKIILGTANLNNTYGYNKNFLSENDFRKILIFLQKKNFFYLDTALNYKNSQKIISKYISSKTKLITKLPRYDEKTDIDTWFKKNIRNIFSNFKIKKIYCILFHHPDDLLGPKGKIIYNKLNDLKKKKILKKIGVSAYDQKTVDKILKIYKMDIVQLPLSVFDQRILKYNWLKKLKKTFNLKIHIRSVFFQGFLTDNYNKDLNLNKFLKLKMSQWDTFCKKKSIKKNIAAIKFINQIKEADNFIVGVNSFEQFKENFLNKKSEKNIKFSKHLQIYDENITNLSKNNILNEK